MHVTLAQAEDFISEIFGLSNFAAWEVIYF